MKKLLTLVAAALLATSFTLAKPEPAEARHGRFVAGLALGLAGAAIIGSHYRHRHYGYYGYGPRYYGYYRPRPYYYGGYYPAYSYGYYPRRHWHHHHRHHRHWHRHRHHRW